MDPIVTIIKQNKTMPSLSQPEEIASFVAILVSAI